MSKSSALSAREREVLSHIASGHTYVQTARRMGIRACTVDTYLRRIRAKSGAVTGAELTRLALALESGDVGMATGTQGTP